MCVGVFRTIMRMWCSIIHAHEVFGAIPETDLPLSSWNSTEIAQTDSVKYRLAQTRKGRVLGLYYAGGCMHTDVCLELTCACEHNALVHVYWQRAYTHASQVWFQINLIVLAAKVLKSQKKSIAVKTTPRGEIAVMCLFHLIQPANQELCSWVGMPCCRIGAEWGGTSVPKEKRFYSLLCIVLRHH
jgi:hypothetical protein